MSSSFAYFPRYQVLTFGEPADWLHCFRPQAINSHGIIAGSCYVGAHTEGGFIFDGKDVETYGLDAVNLIFSGIDELNYAFGACARETGSVFVSARAGSSELRAVNSIRHDCVRVNGVTPDGLIYGHALFLQARKNSRGYYGGFIAHHIEGEIQPFDPVHLTKEVAKELAKHYPQKQEPCSPHLEVNGRNAAGTFLITGVRIGGGLESVPFLLDPNGKMRFGFGERWFESPTGSDSAVMGADGTFMIQAKCSVPPHHTVFWVDPNEQCGNCGRQRHAVFVTEDNSRRNLSPEICGCLEPLTGHKQSYDSSSWNYYYYGPKGQIRMNGNWNDIWIGEVGYARGEGAGWGAIWRRIGDKFHFARLNELVEDFDGLILAGTSINSRGQIACRVVLPNGGYVGARLDPI